jgi:hypothetical protein
MLNESEIEAWLRLLVVETTREASELPLNPSNFQPVERQAANLEIDWRRFLCHRLLPWVSLFEKVLRQYRTKAPNPS